MLALANSDSSLALSRSDRHIPGLVLGLLLCAGLIALCCAVLAVLKMLDDSMLVHTDILEKTRKQNNMEKEGSSYEE